MSKERKCMTALCCVLVVLCSMWLVAGNHKNALSVYAAEEGVTDFVSRLYTEILGREADENGLATWTNALLSGEFSGTEVAKGFIMSEEFLNKDMTNEEFVQILYRAFFGREADDAGLNTWVDFLDQGYRKSYVFAGFANSTEFGTLCGTYEVEAGSVPVTISEQQPNLSEEEYNIWLFVERLYTEVLGRTPDMLGIQEWAEYLQAGTYSGAEVSEGFIMSAEFQNKSMSNEEYVKVMYQAFFGREADESGLTTWVDAMEDGCTKEYVFAGFANSAEFGVLCNNYGITQGEVEFQEPEAEGISFIQYASEGVTFNSAEAGVIITKKDGYYGAIDYNGMQLVPYEYTAVSNRVNEDGMFALKKEESRVDVFGPDGVVLYSMPCNDEESLPLSALKVNEGVVTYAYGDGMKGYVGAYNLEEGTIIYKSETRYNKGNITAMENGKFYYPSGYMLYEVDSNGYINILYDNTAFAYYASSGRVRYARAPRGQYGFIFLQNDYMGLRFGLLNTNGSDSSLISGSEFAAALGVENAKTWTVDNYWENGMYYSNLDQQCVVYITAEDGTKTKDILLDFSKAKYKTSSLYHGGTYLGTEATVSNIEDIIVAQHDSIILSSSGYYLAGNGDDWFYINKNGEVVADYKDCASFYNGYAAIIKEDGMVYLVDEDFNETATGCAADNVHISGACFVYVKDGVEGAIIVNE